MNGHRSGSLKSFQTTLAPNPHKFYALTSMTLRNKAVIHGSFNAFIRRFPVQFRCWWFGSRLVFPYCLPKGNLVFLTACRKDAEATSPLPLPGPYRLEGGTSSDPLAASCDYTFLYTILYYTILHYTII